MKTTSVRLYQSFYKDEQRQHLNHYCIPFDNTVNETPEFREYPQMKDVNRMAQNSGATHWGLISWKFEQKTLISPHSFLDMIYKNPDYDVYFINPCFIIESFFANPWVHGDWHHKGITQMAYDGLKEIIPEPETLLGCLYPRDRMLFCNYIVGNEKFWTGFFEFIDNYFSVVDGIPDLKERVYSPAGYSGDAQLHNFIFIVERLLSSYLVMRSYDLKVLNYEYTHEEVSTKIDKRDFDSVRLQSDLKKECFYNPHPLKTNSWKTFNQAMIQTKQQLIGLE